MSGEIAIRGALHALAAIFAAIGVVSLLGFSGLRIDAEAPTRYVQDGSVDPFHGLDRRQHPLPALAGGDHVHEVAMPLPVTGPVQARRAAGHAVPGSDRLTASGRSPPVEPPRAWS